jgi:myosin heavy subunit
LPDLLCHDRRRCLTLHVSQVCYTLKGFLEKNRDTVNTDLMNALNTTKMDLVRELFREVRRRPLLTVFLSFTLMKVTEPPFSQPAAESAGSGRGGGTAKRVIATVGGNFKVSSSPPLLHLGRWCICDRSN